MGWGTDRCKWHDGQAAGPPKSKSKTALQSEWTCVEGWKGILNSKTCCSPYVHVVQLLSCTWLSATQWTAACQASLFFTMLQSLLKLVPIESMMPPNHLILCRPLLLLSSIRPSIRVFSNESTLCMRWPNYWRFSFSISPSKEQPGLISFRMDWLQYHG